MNNKEQFPNAYQNPIFFNPLIGGSLSILGGVLAIYLLSEGWLILSTVLYLLSGLAWILYDSIKPRWNRPPYLDSKGLLLLILIAWPFRFVLAIRERRWYLSRPDRFTVRQDVAGSYDSGSKDSFNTWAEALAVAQRKARETEQRVSIVDSANYKYSKLAHGFVCWEFFVTREGKVMPAYDTDWPTGTR